MNPFFALLILPPEIARLEDHNRQLATSSREAPYNILLRGLVVSSPLPTAPQATPAAVATNPGLNGRRPVPSLLGCSST